MLTRIHILWVVCGSTVRMLHPQRQQQAPHLRAGSHCPSRQDAQLSGQTLRLIACPRQHVCMYVHMGANEGCPDVRSSSQTSREWHACVCVYSRSSYRHIYSKNRTSWMSRLHLAQPQRAPCMRSLLQTCTCIHAWLNLTHMCSTTRSLFQKPCRPRVV